jgi:hypothetical protein
VDNGEVEFHVVSGRDHGDRRASEGWADVVFKFHNNEEIGPRMLARIAKHTGLTPEDL